MTLSAPTVPLPIDVELYAGGDWRTVNTDVQWRSAMTIGYGLPNEANSVQPCSLTGLLLGNSSGNYDPSNAVGAYYGTIGRNTPVRVSIRSDVDSFTRTVANGWGTSDSGDAYNLTFAGTGNSASSFAVGSGNGTQTVASTASFCAAATTATWGDVDVAVTVSVLNGVAVTGGNIEPAGIMLRGVGATFYLVKFAITTTGAVTIQILDSNGFSLDGPIVIANVTHTATSIRVRAQAEGQTLRAKAWDPAGPEPSGWWQEVNYYESIVRAGALALNAPGYVGIRSGVATGNTNTHPIVFTYDNLVVRVPRFAGWGFLQPTTDISGKDKTVAVTAGSVLRQLSQGQLPIASPLRHDIPTLPNLLAYWACEDGAAAPSFASAVPGGQPMQIASGAPQLASDSSFVGSAPLPVNNNSYWLGYTGSTDNQGIVQVRFLCKFPAAGTLTNGTVIARVHTIGSVVRWDIVYSTGGALECRVYDSNGVELAGSPFGLASFGVDGDNFRIGLSLEPSGVDIAAQIQAYQQGAPTSGASSFTVPSQGVATCYAVAIGPPGNSLSSCVIGHITVENVFTNMNDLISQVNGFVGEDAGFRMSRLLSYAKIGLQFAGSATALTMLLGPQATDQLYNLIQTAATSDGALLYEPKGSATIAYKSGGGHAFGPADPVALALNRATHDLSTPPVATYDDQNLHNDVTVTQTDGSAIEVMQTTGPLSTSPPPVGVGSYATGVQTNLATPNEVADLASWILHLGVVPTARYPQISINLLRPGNAGLYWKALDVAPDDMISLAGQTPDTMLLLARGYTETLNSDTHMITYNCAPGEPYLCPILDDGVSRLDAGASNLSSGITATANSFGVNSTDGTVWTTSAGDLPLDIMMGGERMTIGGIANITSPQIFSSVTRSVNGVVKTHNTGEAITIAQPLDLALGR